MGLVDGICDGELVGLVVGGAITVTVNVLAARELGCTEMFAMDGTPCALACA